MGMRPLDVIRWATRNGARMIGAEETLGTIEEGKLADLLVVDGDPSLDVSLLQQSDKLLAIVKGGELIVDRLTPEAA